MRHLVGIVLAVAAAVVIFFAGGWGYLKLLRLPSSTGALATLPGGGGSLLHDRNLLVAMAAMLAVGVTHTAWGRGAGTLPAYTPGAIGQSFLGPNLLLFEGTSLVLLVSLVGAIIIARKEE